MGSMCCKKLESPYSPKLPDFNKLFLTCSDQIQICRKTFWEEDDPEPKQRKFSASDISYPLPLGCTILPPKRPPRKKRMNLDRTTSVRVKSIPQLRSELRRSKSIHEIKVSRSRLEPIEEAPSDDRSRVEPPPLDSPNADEIVLNVILAASGPSVLDSPTQEPDSPQYAPDDDDDALLQYSPVVQVPFSRPYFSDFGTTLNLPPLEPIMESAFESLESTSSVSLVAENKKHFLAALLEENNNNSSTAGNPSRKSSITESLREFECSLYDMLEQESTKDEVEDLKWRPQIPTCVQLPIN